MLESAAKKKGLTIEKLIEQEVNGNIPIPVMPRWKATTGLAE
jgi:hypothetical protein